MLFNSFYHITDTTTSDSKHVFGIKLEPSHAIFEGHFPGNPITPGVVQIEIIKELLEQSLSTDVRLLGISNCKFLNILNPEEDASVKVEITNTAVDSKYKVDAVIKTDEKVFLKLKAEYR